VIRALLVRTADVQEVVPTGDVLPGECLVRAFGCSGVREGGEFVEGGGVECGVEGLILGELGEVFGEGVDAGVVAEGVADECGEGSGTASCFASCFGGGGDDAAGDGVFVEGEGHACLRGELFDGSRVEVDAGEGGGGVEQVLAVGAVLDGGDQGEGSS
jgi:hypothetical protein